MATLLISNAEIKNAKPTPLAYRLLTFLATLPAGPQIVTNRQLSESWGLADRSGSIIRAQKLTNALGWVRVSYVHGPHGIARALELTEAGRRALREHLEGSGA